MQALDATSILEKLERFGISTVGHGQSSLVSHLLGTHELLQTWGSSKSLCLAGLCHSIYGTESFSKTPVTLESRDFVRSLIGLDAEKLAYLFGAHQKESLWENLSRSNGFTLFDRFEKTSTGISSAELEALITLTLANWLEQRPRAQPEDRNLRVNEFKQSKRFLSKQAYDSFLTAYGLTSD